MLRLNYHIKGTNFYFVNFCIIVRLLSDSHAFMHNFTLTARWIMKLCLKAWFWFWRILSQRIFFHNKRVDIERILSRIFLKNLNLNSTNYSAICWQIFLFIFKKIFSGTMRRTTKERFRENGKLSLLLWLFGVFLLNIILLIRWQKTNSSLVWSIRSIRVNDWFDS